MYAFRRLVRTCWCLLMAGSVLLLVSNRASAEMVSDKWQKEIPAEAMSLKEAGRLFIKEKKYSEAIEALEKSITIKPDFYLAVYDLGLAYALRGFNVDDFSEKDSQRGHEFLEQALRIAIENGFQDAYIYYVVGWSKFMRFIFSHEPGQDVVKLYLEIDQLERQALQIDPSLEKAHHLLGAISEFQGDLERALIHYSRAKDLGDKMVEDDIMRMRTFIDKQ